MASVDGLASGLNTTDIINQLMQLERQPQVRLQARQRATETSISTLRALNTKFLAIGTAAQKLGAVSANAIPSATPLPSDWTLAKATSTDPTRVTVPAATGASPASLSFHVKQLASAASSLTTRTWAAPTDAFGTGASVTLSKGGQSFVVPTGTGSLADTAAAINRSTAGVTASVLQTTPGTYRLALASTTTGAASGFTIADGAGAVGTTPVVAAQDAELSLNGTLITRASNTVTDVLQGVTMTLTKADPSTTVGSTTTFSGPPVTVSVSRDTEGITERVAALVDAANAAAKEIRTLTAADPVAKTKGQLYGDSSVRGLVDRLRTAVSGGTADGALAGVTVTREGTIVLNKDVFTKALAADPAVVETALGKNGMAGRIQALVDEASRSATDALGPGVITNSILSREGLVAGFKSNIASWDARLAMREKTLQRQYTSLQKALGAAQSQGQWLAGQLANLPKWG